MQVGGNGVDLFGLYGLAIIFNQVGLLWACGVAMRFRSRRRRAADADARSSWRSSSHRSTCRSTLLPAGSDPARVAASFNPSLHAVPRRRACRRARVIRWRGPAADDIRCGSRVITARHAPRASLDVASSRAWQARPRARCAEPMRRAASSGDRRRQTRAPPLKRVRSRSARRAGSRA